MSDGPNLEPPPRPTPPPYPRPQEGPNAGQVIGGCVLVLFGLCITLVGGGCTVLLVGVLFSTNSGGLGDAGGFLVLSLALLAGGIASIWAGIRLLLNK